MTVIKEKGDSDHVQFAITERRASGDVEVKGQQHDLAGELESVSLENRIAPLTFCKAFPFHLVFDRNLKVRQVISR